MSARKPLEDGCVGGVFCEVDGHVEAVRNSRGTTYRHVKLTLGQRKSLIERRRAARAATAEQEADR